MSDETLNDLLPEFLESIEGQSAMSQRNYRHRLAAFLESFGEYAPDEVRRRHVNSWHEFLKEKNLAEATMAGYRQALRRFFNWLVEEGYVDKNPTAHLKIGSFLPARPKLPPEEDVERITTMVIGWLEDRRITRKVVSGGRWRFSNTLWDKAYPERWQVRDAALWLLCRGCGPRAGEIRNLKLSSLRRGLEQGPDEVGIYTMTSTGKTGATVMRFDERTAQALRDWLEVRPGNAEADRVFVSTRELQGEFRPLKPSAVSRIMERLAREARIARTIYTHALRHRIGHLTTRTAGPKVAAMLLNHKDAATAATAIAFYHHPDESDVNRAVVNLG